MDLASRIDLARGNKQVDLLLKNCRLVNVFSGEIHSASVAVQGDTIVGFGDYDAAETVDLANRFVAPGFIDGHLHLESSMLAVPEFARNVVPLGTTAVVADPHEIANVLGVQGIRYILDTTEGLPLRVFIMFPSCVPATPFETSGAVLLHEDMEPFKDNPRVLGLAEVMNFPGVINLDPEVLAKIQVFEDKVIDGHAPFLTGKDLLGYVAAGIGSDHECTFVEEAREKLRAGMRIMIREGSSAKNLDALLPLVNEHNSGNCLMVSDDLDPRDIVEQGHVNRILRLAVARGLDPIRAVQMVTINTARYFRLKGLGAVLPGYRADLVVLDDLEQFTVNRVYKDGQLVASDGGLVVECASAVTGRAARSMNVDWEKIQDLSIAAAGATANIIEVVPGQIVTKRGRDTAPVSDGKVVADTDRDILKIAVIERHKGTGAHAVALIRGFGLKKGALACTVAHDAHNIVVVGTNDEDMLAAAKAAADMGGGMVAVSNGDVKTKLPLPIAGLMSDQPIKDVSYGLSRLVDTAHGMGCPLEAPFGTLSFMALSPIPELKITDQGLFDAVNFKFISLFED